MLYNKLIVLEREEGYRKNCSGIIKNLRENCLPLSKNTHQYLMLSCYLKKSYMVLYLYCFVTMKFHMLVSGYGLACARLGLDLSLSLSVAKQ
jgi:hypothetical protein